MTGGERAGKRPGRSPNPGVSEECLKVLEGYDYPGNIRELRNLIERALIESG